MTLNVDMSLREYLDFLSKDSGHSVPGEEEMIRRYEALEAEAETVEELRCLLQECLVKFGDYQMDGLIRCEPKNLTKRIRKALMWEE